MTVKTACIFGGTGFLGRHIIYMLAKKGYRIKVITRFPESGYHLKTSGDVGQISFFSSSFDQNSIERVIANCDLVVNLIGILFEKRKNDFVKVHSCFSEIIAKACAKKNVNMLVHISALGCDRSNSKYAVSKLSGEKLVHKHFPKAVILRPSIVFGPNDSFFNMFAQLSFILPFFPLIGGGKTKFQPVYVCDIAQAIKNILTKNKELKVNPKGKIFELGGPDVEDFKTLYQRLFKEIGRKKMFLSLPFGLAKVQAFFMQLASKPLLTVDQVESLKTDNIVSDDALTLKDLGVKPTPMDMILPTYLICYKSGGHFGNKKAA